MNRKQSTKQSKPVTTTLSASAAAPTGKRRAEDVGTAIMSRKKTQKLGFANTVVTNLKETIKMMENGKRRE